MNMRHASFLALALSIGGTGAIALAQQGEGARAIASRLPQDYAALRERPLFSPDRRPPAPPRVEPPPPPPAAPPPPEPVPVATSPGWELIGVVRSPRVNSAMFRAPGEPAFSLRQGESRDGWILSEVGRFEVSLQNTAGRAKVRFPSSDERQASRGGMMPGIMPGATLDVNPGRGRETRGEGMGGLPSFGMGVNPGSLMDARPDDTSDVKRGPLRME